MIFPIYVSLCAWRSEVHAALGEFEAALASAVEAHRMAREIRHTNSLTIADAFHGYCLVMKGDIEAAIPLLERGLAVAQEHESPHGITSNMLYLEYVRILLKGREASLDSLNEIARSTTAFMPQWARYGSVTAEAYLAAGAVAQAASEVARWLPVVDERQARAYRGPLLRLQAEVLMRQDPVDVDGARKRLEEALTLAKELAMPLEIARCRVGLASVDRRTGHGASAAEHLAGAVAIFRDVGAPFWAERAEAEERRGG